MPDKQSFYQGINETTIFNDEFFKKVYGYSVYDNAFLDLASSKLISIGKNYAVQAYNEWFDRWQNEDNQILRGVARWYQKKLDNEWEQKQKKQSKAVNDWNL